MCSSRLYAGKYRIGFYDSEGVLVMIFDNVLALVMSIEKTSDHITICRWRKKIVNAIYMDNKIIINGVKYTPRKIRDI